MYFFSISMQHSLISLQSPYYSESDDSLQTFFLFTLQTEQSLIKKLFELHRMCALYSPTHAYTQTHTRMIHSEVSCRLKSCSTHTHKHTLTCYLPTHTSSLRVAGGLADALRSSILCDPCQCCSHSKHTPLQTPRDCLFPYLCTLHMQIRP